MCLQVENLASLVSGRSQFVLPFYTGELRRSLHRPSDAAYVSKPRKFLLFLVLALVLALRFHAWEPEVLSSPLEL